MKIDVRVDKRTELLGCLLLISDYKKKYGDLIEECNNKEYRDKIFNWFNKYKDEKAVKLLNRIIAELNFNYDAPVALFLQLNKDFTYDKLLEYPFESRLNKSNLVLELLNELPNFVKFTNFEEFYKSNQDFYTQITYEVSVIIQPDRILKCLNEFYKFDLTNKEFVMNLLPYQTNGNFGVSPRDGVWSNIGVFDNGSGNITFVGKNSTGILLLHEFSHNLINPLAINYIDLPNNYFEKIYKEMAEMTYGDDLTILIEHIIRALEVIFVKYYYKFASEENAKLYMQKTVEEGFIYLPISVDLLEIYYLNRDKYKDFEEYFPILIEEFKKEKEIFDKKKFLIKTQNFNKNIFI